MIFKLAFKDVRNTFIVHYNYIKYYTILSLGNICTLRKKIHLKANREKVYYELSYHYL